MYLDRLGRLNWAELLLAVGLAAGSGAAIAGTPGPQALAFAALATVLVAAYSAWWKGAPNQSEPAALQSGTTATLELERLSRLLQTADAELGHVTNRLRQAEISALEHSRILGELGSLVLPRLHRAEAQVQSLLEGGPAGSLSSTPGLPAERRGHGGQALSTLRETEHLVEALLSLGRAEAQTQPLRPERLDLRHSLHALIGERAGLQIGDVVPTLVYCDRGLFSAMIESLIAQADSSGERPRFSVEAEPRRGDMVLLTLQLCGGLFDRPGLMAAVESGDAMRAAAVLLRESGGETSLALPLALRAATRLGARLAWQVLEDGRSARLTLSLLMTVAPDRRLGERPLVLSDLGLTQHSSG